MNGPWIRAACALCLTWTACRAAGAAGPGTARPDKPRRPATGPAAQMDYGPFLSYSVRSPEKDGPLLAAKGITIDVGNGAAVCFDADTMRMAAGWSGPGGGGRGFLDLTKTNLFSQKGTTAARPGGTIRFASHDGPGWTSTGTLADPRNPRLGPLPPSWAHYKGLYRHGRQIVLSYSVGDADVLERPGSIAPAAAGEESAAFTRTIRVGGSARPMSLLVCDGDAPAQLQQLPGNRTAAVSARAGGRMLAVLVVGAPAGAHLSVTNSTRVTFDLPPLRSPATFKVVLAELASDQLPRWASQIGTTQAAMDDLPALCRGGGPSLWQPSIQTQGHRAADGARPYVVDALALPDDNPWHSWMRLTALDFFADGRCAVATMNGDVWIVSGIDADLAHLTWKRFATGLYEPLGLRIVDDQVYVLGRDQITRLRDLDGDGEADVYENFNNALVTSPVYHAFTFDLQTDSAGDFYYTVDGNAVPLDVPTHGCVMRVSKDGREAQVIATGLRAANGSGMGPDDEFICSDNQGHWTPVCRLNLVRPGGFYGFNGDPRVATRADHARERKAYDPPLCWIPYELDNSTGGQVFAPDPRWGPLHNHFLSTSYGKCKLFEVMWERADRIAQGATVLLPLDFSSGIMRARMNPADGQLYACGMKGWQTSAIRDGCLERVRYTGRPACMPDAVHVRRDGIALSFTAPLDRTSAEDDQNYDLQQWNYRWSSKYGSDKYKLSNPNQVGTDDVDVHSAKLSPDGRTVFLQIDGLRPVMQMGIHLHVNTAGGGPPLETEVDLTINHVPGSTAPPVLSAEQAKP